MFQQKDGVSMGNPLAPTLANYFLGHLENTLFAQNRSDNPAIYMRYVDDIFVIFRKDVDFKPFYERLNNLHRNIKFTYEVGGNTMPFLDVSVTLTSSGVKSTVFRKKTDTNVILNYQAVTPTSWKKGLVKCFMHRAKSICSDKTLFDEEMENLKVIFNKNGYPDSFFDRAKREFINKEDDDRRSEKEKKPIVKIPYIGKPSILYAKRLKKLLMREKFPEIQPIYETTKIQDSFKLKDDQPKEILSNIVYDFTCSGDPSIHYVGHTSRSLRERFLEHIRGGTAISDHISMCDACGTKGVTLENFQVIQRCRTKTESLIHEAMLIKQRNPALNRQLVKIAHTFHLQVFN